MAEFDTTLELKAKDQSRAAFASLNQNLKKTKLQTTKLDNTVNTLTFSVLRATTVFVAFTTAAVAIGSSITAAKRFGRQMAEVETLITDADGAISDYSKTVEDLIRTYGGDFQSTTKALYDTISAGNNTVGGSAKILKAANVAAIAGVSDIATATDALTTVLNSYGLEADSATMVSDILFDTIKAGKTTLSELAPVLGQVTATASSMNVSFQEVGAVLATATAKGIRTSQAVTGLKAVLANIIKPTKDAEDMMTALGVSFNSATLQTKGFAPFFQEILAAAKKNGIESGAAMEKFFASVEGLNTVLALVADDASTFNENLGKIGATAGSTEVAYQKMMKTFDRQWEIFLGKVKVGAKNFGEGILGSLLGPLTTLNENWDLWVFEVELAFAEVTDATRFLTTQVTKSFMLWEPLLNWIVTNVIDPIADAFLRLYNEVVGKSYVPDLVRDVLMWFERMAGGIKDIWNNIAGPIAEGFKKLSFTLTKGAEESVTPIQDIIDNVKNLLLIFGGAGLLQAARVFFGIAVIKIAWAAYDKLRGKVLGYTAAQKANRLAAFQAGEANFKALKAQEKFIDNQAKFAGQQGKFLQKLVNQGGSLSGFQRFVGGNEEFQLAKAKLKDGIKKLEKEARGLSVSKSGKARQSLWHRTVYGNMSEEDIHKRIKKTNKEILKEQEAFRKQAFDKQGIRGRAGPLAAAAGSKIKGGINALRGFSLQGFGQNIAERGRGIARDSLRQGAQRGALLDATNFVSPKVFKTITNLERKWGQFVVKAGVGFQNLSKTISNATAKSTSNVSMKWQKVFTDITRIARKTVNSSLNRTLGKGLVHTMLFGLKGTVAITKAAGKTFGAVSRMGVKARGAVTGGLMAFMMFGHDIAASVAAANAVDGAGKGFDGVKMKFDAAVDAMPDTSLAMLALLGPVGALAGVSVLIFKHWDTVKEIFFNFIAWVKTQDWGQIILAGLKGAGDLLLQLGAWLSEMTLKGMGFLGEGIANLFIAGKNKILDFFDSINPFKGWLDWWNSTEIEPKMVPIVPDSKASVEDINFFAPPAAKGGMMKGAGTGKSDSIPALLSNGEFVVNAAATKQFKPLLEMINAQKFAEGGTVDLLGGDSLSDLVGRNKSISRSKETFIATFGNVDFTSAQKFLNTLFNLKLTEKDISGLSPETLRQINLGMRDLSRSTEEALGEIGDWTVAAPKMSDVLTVSSEATAEWTEKVKDIIQPLLDAGQVTQKVLDDINASVDDLSTFAGGWAEAMQEWQSDIANLGDKGERAAGMLIGALDSALDALLDGASVGDSIKESIKNAAKATAKDTIKTAISSALTGLSKVDKNASNVFNATGQVLMNASGPVTITGAGAGISGIGKLFGGTGGTGAAGGGVGGAAGLAALVGSSFASGGVPPVGQVSLVGEKGPELFIPSQKGQVIPNNKLKNMGKPVQINQTLNITEAMDPKAFQQELIKNNRIVVSLVDDVYKQQGRNTGPYR